MVHAEQIRCAEQKRCSVTIINKRQTVTASKMPVAKFGTHLVVTGIHSHYLHGEMRMNNNLNFSDFVGLSLESTEDYEPYGYAPGLHEIDLNSKYDHARTSASIESVIFADAANAYE
jgi:hypothetical protein